MTTTAPARPSVAAPQEDTRRQARTQRTRRVALLLADYGCMTVLALVFIAPLLFMVVSSFKLDRQIFADLRTVVWAFVPREATLLNYQVMFQRADFARYFANSLIVTAATVLGGLFINSMFAFVLARLRLPGKRVLVSAIIALIIVPLEAIAVPMLVLVNSLPGISVGPGSLALTTGWLNTHHVQVIPFIANAFYIFLFYQFFLDIPKDFDEAARVDGATPFGIYWRIILPMSLPVLSTVAILQSLFVWNAYLWPLMTTRGPAVAPLPIGIAGLYIDDFQNLPKWGPIMAFATLATLPVLVLFLVFQRGFIRSISASGVKG